MSITLRYYDERVSFQSQLPVRQIKLSYAQCLRPKCRPKEFTLCLKNIPDVFSYNSRKRCRIFIIFGRILLREEAIKRYYIFPLHLVNASALPYETANMEIVSFHVNVAC